MKNLATFGFTGLGYQTGIKLKLKLSPNQLEILKAKFPTLLIYDYKDRKEITYTKVIGALHNSEMPEFYHAKDLALLYSKTEFLLSKIDHLESNDYAMAM